MNPLESRYQFPTVTQAYPDILQRKPLKRVRMFCRFMALRFVNRAEIRAFEDYLNQHPMWIEMLQQNPYRIDALLVKFCDSRFSRQARLTAILNHFSLAEQFFGKEECAQLIAQRSIRLATLTDELSLYLNINAIDHFEGFFSLNIQNAQRENLYDASFSFIAPNQLLIASIQGPNRENALELVKLTTKQLHGMRPMFMLVNAFKMVSKVLGLTLVGIPHKAQAKYRWNDSSRLLFNYDEFWQENGAQLHGAYWQIPMQVERKPLEEIASKKRSMYRKRYEMFDEMAVQICKRFKKG